MNLLYEDRFLMTRVMTLLFHILYESTSMYCTQCTLYSTTLLYPFTYSLLYKFNESMRPVVCTVTYNVYVLVQYSTRTSITYYYIHSYECYFRRSKGVGQHLSFKNFPISWI